MTKPANMTDRELQSLRNEGRDDAADEIEHLALDLHTERAAVEALQATVAGLRKSAALRVQFHAAELADVIAERDHAVEQAAKNADEVLRLRAEVAGLREDAERFISLAEAMIADDDTQDTILDRLIAADPDPKTVEAVRAAIDVARKAAP